MLAIFYLRTLFCLPRADRLVSWEEFEAIFHDNVIKSLMGTLELDTSKSSWLSIAFRSTRGHAGRFCCWFF